MQMKLFTVHSEKHPSHVVQPTSQESYHSVPLGERQMEYVMELRDIGHPSTDLEVAEHAGHMDPNYFRPRRNELVKKGLVVEDCTRTCRVSGRMAKTWRLRDGRV